MATSTIKAERLPAFYGELVERYHHEPLTGLARSLGLSYHQLRRHAKRLGLRRTRKGSYRPWARAIIKKEFSSHSIRELARLAKVSTVTVSAIIRELGLKHTPEELRAIRSRSRKEMLEKERMRVNWGLPQRTRLKVYANHRKTTLRADMKRAGYIVDDDDPDRLYYPEGLKRRTIREEHGREMGLRFYPLPDDYWDEEEVDYEEDADYEDDDLDYDG